MGGRRSYYIKDVVKSNKNSEEARLNLNKSIKSGNLEEVARESANLIVEHRDIAKILIYSKKLFSILKGKYSSDELTILKEINKIVRVDWAEVKNLENFESNTFIDTAVIDNVSRVLKDRS
ncbi:MAG: hypothetical protein GWP19_09350 [Planctomycetia bacterium]|nr:hypothetical protein [Planctomycetia bacterium]